MARPIEATPILTGRDAELFLKDLEETNKKMEDPVYRKKVMDHLEKCERLYKKFQARLVKSL